MARFGANPEGRWGEQQTGWDWDGRLVGGGGWSNERRFLVKMTLNSGGGGE
jgi:hypothetical protein